MQNYESQTDSRGRTHYYVHLGTRRQMIAKAKIPEGAFIRDRDADAFTPPTPTPEELADIEARAGLCVVCGGPGEMQRLVVGTMVDLCADDYYQQTLGDLVTALRRERQMA